MAESRRPSSLGAFAPGYLPDIADVIDWGQFARIQDFVETALASDHGLRLRVTGEDGCTFAVRYALGPGRPPRADEARVIILSARGEATTPRAALAHLLNVLQPDAAANSRTPVDQVIADLRQILDRHEVGLLPPERHLVVGLLDVHDWSRQDARDLRLFDGLERAAVPVSWILDLGRSPRVDSPILAWPAMAVELPAPDPQDILKVLKARCKASGMELPDEALLGVEGERLSDRLAGLAQILMERKPS